MFVRTLTSVGSEDWRLKIPIPVLKEWVGGQLGHLNTLLLNLQAPCGTVSGSTPSSTKLTKYHHTFCAQ